MKIKQYLKKLRYKVQKANRKAKNPFLDANFEYNPFMSAIEQSYIWIERKTKK